MGTPCTNAFTVDVEEWFHICGADGPLSREHWDSLPSRVVGTTRRLLDELDRAGVRATFFVLGWVAERHPALVAEIVSAGHEIGSHGYSHGRAYELGRSGFAEDLRRARGALRAAGVREVGAYRAPEWSINDRSMWALEELVRQGFAVDASMAPVRLVGSVQYPRRPHVVSTDAGSIVEIPPFVVQTFGQVLPLGWGWCLRMSSPQRVLRMVEAANQAGSPAVFMVHPWELDPDPPRVHLPLRLRFAHYFRLGGFRDRLAAVLRGGHFGAIGDLAGPLMRSLALFASLGLTAAPAAWAQMPTAPAALRIAVEDAVGSSEIPGVFRADRPLPVPVAVRLSATLGGDSTPLDERLSIYRDRKIPVWLSVPAPSGLDEVTAWRTALAGVLGRHGGGISILEIAVDAQDPKLAAFVVRMSATDVRAEREAIQISLGGPRFHDPLVRRRYFTAEVAAHLDLLSLPAGSDANAAATELRDLNPAGRVAIWGAEPGDAPDVSARRLLDAELETLGTDPAVRAWRSSESVEPAIRLLAPLAGLMSGEISVLDPAAASLVLEDAGRDVTRSVRHRLLFDNKTFATYLVYWAEPSADPLEASLTLPVEGVPAVYRLADGARLQATAYSRSQESGTVRTGLPRPGGPVLVDFNEGAAEVFVERSGVSAERQLTVHEVIARHQQQQRSQDALVRNYIASARMEQHFRPTMTDPGYDVVTENRYFVANDGIEWEELSFSVNGSKWGSDRPPFPLLQPEKVLSLPLQLRFGSDYRYRLAGTERIGEYDCYAVRFDPVGPGQSLYRGTVWIDKRTFARIRVQAVQTSLSAPVVSNEEIQTYAPIAVIGNRPIFLFAGLDARQIMLIAGRNLLVEKRVTFHDFRVNEEQFGESRSEARRSDHVMYRETDRGLRYYVKEGEKRVVSERATRTARAMAMGVTLDPSYAFPLPILGINYLNFEFRGRPDTQLAVLFAGVLAAGNLQRPKIGGTPFDASVDFFAIAVPSTDTLFDASGERERERLLTWPLTTGVNIGWQYTPFQKLTGQYQFRFDGYVKDRTTEDTFRLPVSTVTNGFGGAWEYRRAGYSLVLNGTWFARSGWRHWGFEATPSSGSRPTYAKYSASLSRDFYFNVFHKVHLNAAWFGGRDLDRFAKYQFGMFDDTRIHGVPSSGVRFGELGVARGGYSFNIFDQYRLDLFFEQAWGRDRAFDDRWQPITGIGAAVNFRAPWNTILRTDFGKSFLPDRYGGVGSATLQVMVLKPLR